MLSPAAFREVEQAPGDEGTRRAAESLMNAMRSEMDGTMGGIRARSQTYLNWYSPPYDSSLKGHDAWLEPIGPDDVGTTRSTLTVSRAVVDIWAALEASAAPLIRAEPERLGSLIPSLDQGEMMKRRQVYDWHRSIESIKSDMRSARIRKWLRRDDFDVKQFYAVRKKNLHGFSWMKVLPDRARQVPSSYVIRDPTTIYPMWSSRTPGDLEGLLSAQQMSANLANAKWDLGLEFESDGRTVRFPSGGDSGSYRYLNDRSYDDSRTQVWVEELWWLDREYQDGPNGIKSIVRCAVRVGGKVIDVYQYPGWRFIPWVYWQNTDERDEYGWSDVANVMDINDEMNRRISQQGDTIGMYSSPRFQMLGSVYGRDIEMPGPFQKVDLQDTERIEQILTRIDTYPTDRHFDMLIDMLHRDTGLPPIVWGLIANAQTSGRALTASWKATETRLVPRLMANRISCQRWVNIGIDYSNAYGWDGAPDIWRSNDGLPFEDWMYEFPPMEPRDFMEVTQDAITKRDAGIITTIMAMRATGDDAAEDTYEEVQAEFMNIFAHPDKVNAFLLAQRAQMDNMSYAQQVQQQADQQGQGGQPVNTASIAQSLGQAAQTTQDAQAAGTPQQAEPGTLPPTQAGAAGNAGQTAPGASPGPPGSSIQSGTLMRNGKISGQLLQTQQLQGGG